MSDQRNSTLGPYQILDQIAQGAYGEVYRARDVGPAGFQRLVAIKRLRPHVLQDASAVRAFENEARIGGLLTHHNIAQTVGFREDNGVYYLVMEYVDGLSFQDLVGNHRAIGKPIPAAVVLELIAQACDGLHFAHEVLGPDRAPLKLIHRDIKPSNLMLTRTGVVKVMDFGIARVENQNLTDAGFIKGTPRYLSPEMIARHAPIDKRSDLFSLAAVMYELLEGKPLFDAATLLALMGRVRDADVGGQLKELGDRLPSVARLLSRALNRLPDQRFQTGRELARELRRLGRELDAQDVDLETFAHQELEDFQRRQAANRESVRQTELPRPPSPPAVDFDAGPTRPSQGPGSAFHPTLPLRGAQNPGETVTHSSGTPASASDLLARLDARSAMLESQEIPALSRRGSAPAREQIGNPAGAGASGPTRPLTPAQQGRPSLPGQYPPAAPPAPAQGPRPSQPQAPVLPPSQAQPPGPGPLPPQPRVQAPLPPPVQTAPFAESPATVRMDLKKAPPELAQDLRRTVQSPSIAQRPSMPNLQTPVVPPVNAPIVPPPPSVPVSQDVLKAALRPTSRPNVPVDEDDEEEEVDTISGKESPLIQETVETRAPVLAERPVAQRPARPQAPPPVEKTPVPPPPVETAQTEQEMELQVDEDPPSNPHLMIGFDDDWGDEKSRVVSMEELGLISDRGNQGISEDLLKSVADIPIPKAFAVGMSPKQVVRTTLEPANKATESARPAGGGSSALARVASGSSAGQGAQTAPRAGTSPGAGNPPSNLPSNLPPNPFVSPSRPVAQTSMPQPPLPSALNVPIGAAMAPASFGPGMPSGVARNVRPSSPGQSSAPFAPPPVPTQTLASPSGSGTAPTGPELMPGRQSPAKPPLPAQAPPEITEDASGTIRLVPGMSSPGTGRTALPASGWSPPSGQPDGLVLPPPTTAPGGDFQGMATRVFGGDELADVLKQGNTGFEQMSTRMLPADGSLDLPEGTPTLGLPLNSRSTLSIGGRSNAQDDTGPVPVKPRGPTHSSPGFPVGPSVPAPLPPVRQAGGTAPERPVPAPQLFQNVRPGSIVFRGKSTEREKGFSPLIWAIVALIAAVFSIFLLSKL